MLGSTGLRKGQGPARQVAVTGLLGALALALSFLEGLLPPLPMLPPGAKLGLSNIAVMYAVQSLGLFPALGIALVKGVFAGLTRGGTAMIMSLSGGLTSTLVLWLLARPKNPLAGSMGMGVAGALAHNLGQLLAAAALTTPAVAWYAPWLLLFGVLFGIVTGFVLRVTLPVFNRLSPFVHAPAAEKADSIPSQGNPPEEGKKSGGKESGTDIS